MKIRPNIYLTTLSIIGSIFFANIALAQPAPQQSCNKRDAVIERLNTKYKEYQAAIGLVKNNGMMELYASRDGTWTIMVTTIDGSNKISCLIMAGNAFGIIKEIKELEGIEN